MSEQLLDETGQETASDVENTGSDEEIKSESSTVPALVEKNEADKTGKSLVEEACTEITRIYSNKVEECLVQVGEYLIEKFFGGDYEKARGKDKIKDCAEGASLSQVFQHFKKTGTESPSKSWLYQSIDYVIQERDIKEKIDDEDSKKVSSGKNDWKIKYRHWLLSYKVELLTVKDIDKKIEIIKEIELSDVTVSKIHELIKGKGFVKSRSPGLLTIVKDPSALDSELDDKFSTDALRKVNLKTLKKLRDESGKKWKEIRDQLLDYEASAKRCEASAKRYNTLRSRLNTLISNKEKKLPPSDKVIEMVQKEKEMIDYPGESPYV
jgi:hypothetical protein